MKKIQLLLVMILLVSSCAIAQSTKKKQYLKPTNNVKRVTTVISEKQRSYYSFSSKDASIISVKGPGVLLVKTRGRFIPNEESKKISYDITYIIDGGIAETENVTGVVRSKNATYQNGALGVPAESRDLEIELGRGLHTIEFLLASEDIRVAARYYFLPHKAKKRDWIAFSPTPPSEPADLITGESSVCYYRFSNTEPLHIDVIGPTELRVLTRIENHYDMKGNIHYRIQVLEDQNVINTYQLSSRRSEVAQYKDDKDLVPGKACEFVITVPKGKHSYEIIPLDKDKTTVLGRCMIPTMDVKLKKQ